MRKGLKSLPSSVSYNIAKLFHSLEMDLDVFAVTCSQEAIPPGVCGAAETQQQVLETDQVACRFWLHFTKLSWGFRLNQ